MSKLYVIGIGYKPFEKRAREIILKSGIILASNRLHEVFKGYEEYDAVRDKIKVIKNVDETINFIKSQISSMNIVLLASGDPMFFGIGRRAVREFGKETVEIIPDLSSIQIAFSRIKIPWDDAFLMSLHGGPDPEKRRRLPYEMEDIPVLLKKHPRIVILTDKENNPASVARFLSSLPQAIHSSLRIYVCERLGYPDERIVEGTPGEISAGEYREPNIIILEDRRTEEAEVAGSTVRFGLKEDEIIHSRGLITKDEVRAITLHKLRLPERGVFWDIGAGSGSVSVEASRLSPGLRVFAVEKSEEQVENIKKNILSYDIRNIEVITGEAPEALKGLPSPDRVFVGGSGRRLGDITGHLSSLNVKDIVINISTLDTLTEAIAELRKNGYQTEVSEVSVARSKPVAGRQHLSAMNPVFIVTARRDEDAG